MSEGQRATISTDDIFDDYRYSNVELLIFDEFLENPIKIYQNFRYGKGGIFWDSSYVMTKYIQNLDFTNKWILELGAGTALPSILSFYKGANVVATDILPVLNLTQRNLEANTKCSDNTWTARELNWEDQNHRENLAHYHFDYILMSDVCYLPDLAVPLCETLYQLSSLDTTIILSYKQRIPEISDPFFTQFSNKFSMELKDDDIRGTTKNNELHLAILKKLP
ncbi:VCPKMT [Blepharisma stoltei]|uniref:Uncharacterized protein n=1 Tax=Blepharisma stoltei TaxID=1481888 RepID=A0AAU9JBU4_9CILI|nr:unnamed protein product [Blepharisma stoltei]